MPRPGSPVGWEGAHALGWGAPGNCPQPGLTAAAPFSAHPWASAAS